MVRLFEDEDIKDLSAIARIVEEQSRKETEEAFKRFRERNRKENMKRYGCDCPAAKCYLTCPKYLAHSKEDDLFYYLQITRPEDNRIKEYLQPMPAPPAKSGGNKNGRKKKTPTIKKLYLEC